MVHHYGSVRNAAYALAYQMHALILFLDWDASFKYLPSPSHCLPRYKCGREVSSSPLCVIVSPRSHLNHQHFYNSDRNNVNKNKSIPNPLKNPNLFPFVYLPKNNF